MKQVLLVEDSSATGSLIKNYIESMLSMNVLWVQTYKEAIHLIDNFSASFFVGLLDINLPIAPHGEIVDYAISKKMPTVVFTADSSNEQHKMIWSKHIVDYVMKEGPDSLDYIVSLLKRLEENKKIKILVIDDSPSYRKIICNYLRTQNYKVYDAENGKKGLEILEENTDIKMLIIDYKMPDINGFQLTKMVRQRYKKEQLAIIGMSSEESEALPARFIKFGANDFLVKPFHAEEFYCRVNQNIDLIKYVETIKDASYTDFLTGLYNRRYFYQFGEMMYANADRNNLPILIGMVDIDYFKKVNDTYGHEAGDLVLKNIARILKNRFRKSDIVSRFGGEEFCILGTEYGSEPCGENF